MHGIYSDGDRSNAQLEITALLAEIDKIASNTAFNGVKVLDGSWILIFAPVIQTVS